MSQLFATKTTTLIKATSLSLILKEYIEHNVDYEVAIQKLNGDDGYTPTGYRLEVHGAGTPLQIDVPAALNTLDIIELARTLDKTIPEHYPLLAQTKQRTLSHELLLWADKILSNERAVWIWLNKDKPENKALRVIRIHKDIHDDKPYILATLVEGGEDVKNLNSRGLKWLLKREPEMIVYGKEEDVRSFEMVIDDPDSLPTYISIDTIDTKGYHLMPFAQRIGYKLMQIKHDDLLFTKRGTKIKVNINKDFHKTLGF